MTYGFQGFSLENPYEPKKAKAPIPGAPAVPADTPIGPAPGQPAQGGGARSAAPPRPAGSTFTPPRVGGQEGTMGQQGGGLPYGTGDNRRQAGQMPLKGVIGAPPSGGFRRATWGNVDSGSAGQGNMPGPARGGPGGFGGPGGRTDLGGGGGNVQPGGGQRTIAPMPTGPAQPAPARGVNVGPGGAPVDQPTTTMPAAPAGMPISPRPQDADVRPVPAAPAGGTRHLEKWAPGSDSITAATAPAWMANWWKPQPVGSTGLQGGGPAIANPYEQPRRAAAPPQDGGGSTGVTPATPFPQPEGASPLRPAELDRLNAGVGRISV